MTRRGRAPAYGSGPAGVLMQYAEEPKARTMHRSSSRSGESAGLTRRATEAPANVLLSTEVPRFIDIMTFADGSCEARSRSKEKTMQGHRRRRATQRSPATPISPKGGGGTASISLSLLLRDAHRHHVVVASRTRRRRARHKRHHIYEARHLRRPTERNTGRADDCADVVERV